MLLQQLQASTLSKSVTISLGKGNEEFCIAPVKTFATKILLYLRFVMQKSFKK